MRSDPTFANRVASIDIGTNTILLLIADVEGRRLRPLLEMETVVRLGKGLHKNGVILAESMEKGYRTLAEYLDRCREKGTRKIFAVGTSALREAENSAEFLELVKRKLDLPIEVISGEEEAHLSFLAVARDLDQPETTLMVIDVGGGSTEFILGKNDRVIQWTSLPIGLVHFTERFLASDPVQEEEWEEMGREVQRLLFKIPPAAPPFSLVSVGGTGTTLASVEQGLQEFIPGKIHHFVLGKEALRRQLLLFRSKTIEERKKIPGLPPARADVILAGGTILYLAMEAMGCPEVSISSHGVRYGLLYKRLNPDPPAFSKQE